ncbi:MAG: hypothetical protein AAGI17_04225 [Planctomycetota bacterium]
MRNHSVSLLSLVATAGLATNSASAQLSTCAGGSTLATGFKSTVEIDFDFTLTVQGTGLQYGSATALAGGTATAAATSSRTTMEISAGSCSALNCGDASDFDTDSKPSPLTTNPVINSAPGPFPTSSVMVSASQSSGTASAFGGLSEASASGSASFTGTSTGYTIMTSSSVKSVTEFEVLEEEFEDCVSSVTNAGITGTATPIADVAFSVTSGTISSATYEGVIDPPTMTIEDLTPATSDPEVGLVERQLIVVVAPTSTGLDVVATGVITANGMDLDNLTPVIDPGTMEITGYRVSGTASTSLDADAIAAAGVYVFTDRQLDTNNDLRFNSIDLGNLVDVNVPPNNLDWDNDGDVDANDFFDLSEELQIPEAYFEVAAVLDLNGDLGFGDFEEAEQNAPDPDWPNSFPQSGTTFNERDLLDLLTGTPVDAGIFGDTDGDGVVRKTDFCDSPADATIEDASYVVQQDADLDGDIDQEDRDALNDLAMSIENADWDGDGDVDMDDMNSFIADQTSGLARADYNCNGVTNISDLFAYTADFNAATGP